MARSTDRSHLEACSLVLSARGIAHTVTIEESGTIAIQVEEDSWQQANAEISAYLEENRDWPPPPTIVDEVPMFRLMGVMVSGCLGIIHGLSGPWHPEAPWFRQGAGDAAAILQQGEYYRLVTALTLHADDVHLMSNCLLGAVIVHYFLGLTGNGLGLCLILVTATTANWLNVVAHGSAHHFVGFSTALFATIGLLCTMGYALKRRHLARHLFMPLMAALALLAFLGSQGEHTDLGSHFFGLFCGRAAGNVARLPGFARLRASLSVQIVLSLAFFLIFAGAWALALA